MKKLIVLILVLVLASSGLAGCRKQEEEAVFGWGTLDYGKSYSNDFFGFYIELNPDMTYLSHQEIADANPPMDENGQELDPIDISSIEDLSKESIVQFVYGKVYGEDIPDVFNSYINIFSENMSSIGQTMNKENYVTNYMDFSKYLYKGSMIEVETYPLEKPWISGRQFAKGTLKIDYEQYTVFQEMYAITKGSYILVIMCVYTNQNEKEMFDQMINSIEID